MIILRNEIYRITLYNMFKVSHTGLPGGGSLERLREHKIRISFLIYRAKYRKLVLLSRTSTKNFTKVNIYIVVSTKHSTFLGRIVLLLELSGVDS
jgi:hypothetical protein